MIFRQLDIDGDWTFGAGLANYASGQQAIALNIKTSVLMWQGDCFFSLPKWINWKGLMNIGQQKNLDSALQALLTRCYGVMSVEAASVIINRTTRRFFASYTVNTVYSTPVTTQVQILSGQVGT